MGYVRIEDVAEELNVDRDVLQKAIGRLEIKTLKLTAPPHGDLVSAAVDREDAERLRGYFAALQCFSRCLG
jgi:Mn-dependent DtxR family transcriptional regulator